MQGVEDLGFSVMASYEAKLTMAEGVALGAGSVMAYAAAYLASRSLAESDDKASSLKKAIDVALKESFEPAQIDALQPVKRRMLAMEIEPSEVPRLVPLLQTISANRTKKDLENVESFIKSAHDLEMLSTIGKMPLPEKDYVSVYDHDWEKYAKDVAEFQLIPEFYKTLMHKGSVLNLWRESLEDEDVMAGVLVAKTAMESVNGSPAMVSAMRSLLRDAFILKEGDKFFEEVDRDEPGVEYQNDWWVYPLKELIDSGMIGKFDEVASPHVKEGPEKQLQEWQYKRLLQSYLKHFDNIGHWDTYEDLVNEIEPIMAMEREGLKVVPALPLDRARRNRAAQKKVNAVRRARDRLAQRDPDWAISEFPAEYQRGRRIARFLKEIADSVEDMVKRGEVVVIHGRDGELLYDLLRRRPGIDKSKIRYAITSRALTTWTNLDDIEDAPLHPAHRQDLGRYYDYLSRLIPVGAVHIDTGFEGSVPRWLGHRGFKVKKIRMMSTDIEGEEIPISVPMTRLERRHLVGHEVEGGAQRLDSLKRYRSRTGVGGFGGVTYSKDAPGYHARAYGVYDELGLPRIAAKTPRTRFEERQRLRLAADEPSSAPKAVMEEETLLKVK